MPKLIDALTNPKSAERLCVGDSFQLEVTVLQINEGSIVVTTDKTDSFIGATKMAFSNGFQNLEIVVIKQ